MFKYETILNENQITLKVKTHTNLVNETYSSKTAFQHINKYLGPHRSNRFPGNIIKYCITVV